MKTMTKTINGLAMLGVGIGCVWPGAARGSGITGATVNVSAFFDSTTIPYTDPGNVVVDDAVVEYPAGSYFMYNDAWEVDITDTQIKIRNVTGQFSFTPNPVFNGFIFEMIDGPDIFDVSVNPASAYAPVELSLEGKRILMNFQGLTGQATEMTIIDLSTTDVCYVDCDMTGSLDISDFICFQTLFAIGDPYADCDMDTSLTIDDFICFQTLFAVGC